MGLGRFTLSGTISTNADTAVVPIPAARQRNYLVWLSLTVSVAGTTSRLRVEDGVGGSVLARMSTVTADATQVFNFSTGLKDDPGEMLAEGNPLNINTSGGAAATINWRARYEVRGA